MRCFDPTCPQHWPDLGPTSASKAPASAQLGPSSLQLRPNLAPRWRNLAPRWRNLAPAWTHLRATSAQVEVIWLRNGGHSWPIRNHPNARFHCYFDASFEAMFPMLCLGWSHAVAKGSQVAPLWTWLGLPCASHGFKSGSIWIALGPIGSNLGSSGILVPNPGQFCGLNATRWKLAVWQRFLALMILMGFVQGHVAHIGPVLGPTSAPDASTILHTQPSCTC